MGDEVTGGCRRMHNNELHNLYSSPNIIRIIISEYEMGRTCRMLGEVRHAYKILVGKPEGKTMLRRSQHNIKMDHKERGWEGEDWIKLVQVGIGGGLL
jgi:hypothetical protein